MSFSRLMSPMDHFKPDGAGVAPGCSWEITDYVPDPGCRPLAEMVARRYQRELATSARMNKAVEHSGLPEAGSLRLLLGAAVRRQLPLFG